MRPGKLISILISCALLLQFLQLPGTGCMLASLPHAETGNSNILVAEVTTGIYPPMASVAKW